jgi:hypothetical protein
MTKLSADAPRVIIEDFKREIRRRWTEPKKPVEWAIKFRNEERDGKTRRVWQVPIELLRYRRDNGRIATDVISYEKQHGALTERSEEAQRKLADFLLKKDPEPTEELKRSMRHQGQTEPAIITADGFLINGNRRKLVLEELRREHPDDDRFKYMRVVHLPGATVEPGNKDDEGGAPTLKEIEQIENRYQLFREGKAPYSNFDRALSIRMKMNKGIDVEAQLMDDPYYAELSKKKLQQEVQKYTEAYLVTLDCIDRYLEQMERGGLYDTVSSGIGDKEGRWEAFYDYTKSYLKLRDDRERARLGIHKKDVGDIETICFRLIRKRDLATNSRGGRTNLPKVHVVMRRVPELFGQSDAGKENIAKRTLLKINDIPMTLSREDTVDRQGNEISPRDLDLVWGNKYGDQILGALKGAFAILV